MSTKYKFDDQEGVYFVTSTVVDWIIRWYYHYSSHELNESKSQRDDIIIGTSKQK